MYRMERACGRLWNLNVCADQEASREEVAVARVFEHWPGFGDGVMGMDRYFRLWNHIGKESVAGKANVLQDVEAVRLVPTCRAGREGAGEL